MLQPCAAPKLSKRSLSGAVTAVLQQAFGSGQPIGQVATVVPP